MDTQNRNETYVFYKYLKPVDSTEKTFENLTTDEKNGDTFPGHFISPTKRGLEVPTDSRVKFDCCKCSIFQIMN